MTTPWCASRRSGLGSATLLVIVLSLVPLLALSAQAPDRGAGLKRQADRVLELEDIEARDEVDAVFRYAAWLIEKGRHGEAVRYLKSGLKLYAWRLDQQLVLARELRKQGKKKAAGEAARLVFDYAEEDALVIGAAEILGEERPRPEIPLLTKTPEKTPALVLVPLGECEALILGDLARALAEKLGIEVLLRKVDVELPPPGRDPFHWMLDTLRKWIVHGKDRPSVVAAMKSSGITLEELEDDARLVELMEALSREDPDEWRDIRESLAATRRAGVQYDAAALRLQLKALLRPWSRKGLAYLGLMRADLYAEDYNYVFGQAEPGAGVLSYARFRAEFNDEPPKRKRLMDRLLKQALASAGHVFAVERCGNPTCARAFPISLEEHDAKSSDLCGDCKAGFARAFAGEK